MKLYNVNTRESELKYVMRFLQQLYKVHITTKSHARKEYFERFSLFTEYFFKILMIPYYSADFLFFVYPIYVYYTQNELIPLIPLYVLGLDENTETGYIVLVFFQFHLIVMFVVGLFLADYFFAILIISSLIFEKRMSWEMEKINTDLQEKDTKLFVSGRLRNMLQIHQEAME